MEAGVQLGTENSLGSGGMVLFFFLNRGLALFLVCVYMYVCVYLCAHVQIDALFGPPSHCSWS